MSAEVGDVWRSACGMMELRCGDYREVLADVEPDHVIADPPYSERTHSGHDSGGSDRAERRDLTYQSWTDADVRGFAEWCSRSRGWIVAMSDSDLCAVYRAELERLGRTGFQPLPCVIPGMTVRLAGDGPSSWAVYLNVARPKTLSRWGTLRGAFSANRERGHIGGKPLGLMRQIVRDYSRPGDLVCDPCAGGGTTLLAAAIEGRRAVGAELDPATFEKAVKRLSKPYTPATLFEPGDTSGEQTGLDL